MSKAREEEGDSAGRMGLLSLVCSRSASGYAFNRNRF